jgi:hypothetical protein
MLSRLTTTWRRWAGVSAILSGLLSGANQSDGQEPVPPVAIPGESPVVEENVTFGQIFDERLRSVDAQGDDVPPLTDNVLPEPLPDDDAPAKVDTTAVPPVEIGLQLVTADGGVRVTRVREGTAASEAEFQRGDLIRRVGDRAALTPKDIDETLSRFEPLTAVDFVIERGSDKITLSLILPAEHVPFVAPPVAVPSEIETTTEADLVDRARELLRDDRVGWVLIDRGDVLTEVLVVHDGSAAALAGLQSNDVIFAVDGVRCPNAASVLAAIHRHPVGNRAVLAVKRGTQEAFVNLEIPAGVPVPAVIEATPVVPLVVDPDADDAIE